MIHNHEVEGSIPSLATTESPGTECQGFFVSGWEPKTCFRATVGKKALSNAERCRAFRCEALPRGIAGGNSQSLRSSPFALRPLPSPMPSVCATVRPCDYATVRPCDRANYRIFSLQRHPSLLFFPVESAD